MGTSAQKQFALATSELWPPHRILPIKMMDTVNSHPFRAATSGCGAKIVFGRIVSATHDSTAARRFTVDSCMAPQDAPAHPLSSVLGWWPQFDNLLTLVGRAPGWERKLMAMRA